MSVAEPLSAARSPARSGTSFYYAFRILPGRSAGPSTRSTRSAGWWTTAWTSRAARARPACAAGWRRSRRCYAGQPETELGPRAGGGASRASRSRARASRTSSTGCRHGPRPSARYATFADLRVVLRARRLRGGPGLHRDLRLHATRARASTRSSWASRCSSRTSCATSAQDAARGPPVPARWTTWRASASTRGASSLRRRRGRRTPAAVRAAARLPGRARPRRTTRARARAAARRRTGARMALRRDHGRRLPRDAGGAGRAAASRRRPARAALAPAQALDRRCARSPASRRPREGRGGRGRLRRAWPPPSPCRSAATRCTLLERRGVLGGRATSFRGRGHAARTWTTART